MSSSHFSYFSCFFPALQESQALRTERDGLAEALGTAREATRATEAELSRWAQRLRACN